MNRLAGMLGGLSGAAALPLPAWAQERPWEWGWHPMYEADPAQLVDRLLGRYRSANYVCPCRPGGNP